MSNNGFASRPQRIELVLGGGGVRGFGHLGFLKACQEKKVVTGQVTGISIGSAVAALYTNGYSPDQMTSIFQEEIKGLDPWNNSWLPVGSMLWNALRGLDLVQLFQGVCRRYNLKPNENLRILAFNVLKASPVIFEGTDYDLPVAIAASCCIPGIMRPVWYGQPGIIGTTSSLLRSLRGHSDEGVLVDGGVYHPNPGRFSNGPAIISKLGFATRLPQERLSSVDMLFHLGEMAASKPLNWLYPDPKRRRHIIVNTGMPSVGGLSFGVSRETCLAMVEHGYRPTIKVLDAGIACGRIPVKAAAK